MADVIDISLQRHVNDAVERILEERGLAFFLARGGGAPFKLDRRRIELAVELGTRRLGRPVVPAARKAGFTAARRKLIGLLARAMVGAGL